MLKNAARKSALFSGFHAQLLLLAAQKAAALRARLTYFCLKSLHTLLVAWDSHHWTGGQWAIHYHCQWPQDGSEISANQVWVTRAIEIKTSWYFKVLIEECIYCSFVLRFVEQNGLEYLLEFLKNMNNQVRYTMILPNPCPHRNWKWVASFPGSPLESLRFCFSLVRGKSLRTRLGSGCLGLKLTLIYY